MLLTRPPAVPAIAVAIALLASVAVLVPAAAAEPVFSDVPADHPFVTEIEWLADEGLVQPYADGSFRPGRAMARGDLAVLLYRLLGSPDYLPDGPPTFADVRAGHHAYVAVEWLVDAGALTAGAPPVFAPDRAVTRQAAGELVYGLDRPAAFSPPGTPTFVDVPGDHPAFVEVEWLAAIGAVDKAGRSFWPERGLSRAAAAALVHRFAHRDLRTADVVDLRPLSAQDLRIVDDLGRDVLLRGVNVTSLGEYWQGDPDHPPTRPTTDADWAEMASRGMSVVRLVVHWSRLEPVRGQIDEAYLDEIDQYVTAAAAHGLYTVIDMHQDAYSAFISTDDPSTCPPGTSPARGWDGAPAWATITDGLSTCITAERNDSPAVVAAWNHFYDNTDGIRDRFVATWGHVAARFAGRPEVAGYNLLNEPEVSRPSGQIAPLYQQLLADTIETIRLAEAAAPFEHLLFVEPAIPAGNASFGIVIPDPTAAGIDARNVVAAPHNYAEAILVGITIEQMNAFFLAVASSLGLPLWIGEHGFWDTEPATLAKVERFAADQDRLALGGAWWQWRQPCGDPHSISWGGWSGRPPEVITHLHRLSCPGDGDLGPTEEFLDVVGRAYPRATPGRIDGLSSDWATGAFRVEASAADLDAEVVVWSPTTADTHDVVVEGLSPPISHPVPGGRLITARVEDPAGYVLEIVSRP